MYLCIGPHCCLYFFLLVALCFVAFNVLATFYYAIFNISVLLCVWSFNICEALLSCCALYFCLLCPLLLHAVSTIWFTLSLFVVILLATALLSLTSFFSIFSYTWFLISTAAQFCWAHVYMASKTSWINFCTWGPLIINKLLVAGPKTGCFSHILVTRKWAPKKLKNNFLLFFKGSCTLLHCSHILSNFKSC